MRRRWWGSLLIVLTALSNGASAKGEGPPPAAELLREGAELRRLHRDREALTAFERANALSPSCEASAQIGMTRAALADWLAAEESMRAALATPDDPWVARNRAEIDATMTTVASHLGWLVIDLNVPNADMTLDGRALTARSARIVAGRGLLRVHAPGYVPETRAIDVPPGGTARVLISLAPLVAGPSSNSAALAGARPPATPATEDREGPSFAGPIVLGIAGLTALGVGTYFGIRAVSDKAVRDANCVGLACTQEGLDADAHGRFLSAASAASIGVGLAVVGTAVVWLVLARAKPSSPPPAPQVVRSDLASPSFGITRW